jgi:hypothetical protein
MILPYIPSEIDLIGEKELQEVKWWKLKDQNLGLAAREADTILQCTIATHQMLGRS